MEYPKLPDPITESAGDTSIHYEFNRLSNNQAYTILNRDSELSSNLIPVDLSNNVLYQFRVYRDFTLRESSDTMIVRTDRMLIEEGYVVYNLQTYRLSFSNIHRSDGSLYTYQVKYIHRSIDDEPMFIPYLIMYSGDDGLDITMKLDENANIIQVYNATIPMVTGESRRLGICPISSRSPTDHDTGERLIGSKDIDAMTGLAYILSNELTQLRQIGDEMVDRRLLNNYTIS